MSDFDLDIKVSQPSGPDQQAQTWTVVTTTRTLVTKTPVCSKTTCRCTTQGACTAGCTF